MVNERATMSNSWGTNCSGTNEKYKLDVREFLIILDVIN